MTHQPIKRHKLAHLVRPKNTSLTAWSPVVACFTETCGETNHELFPMLKASWRKTNISKHVRMYIEYQTIVCTCLANANGTTTPNNSESAKVWTVHGKRALCTHHLKSLHQCTNFAVPKVRLICDPVDCGVTSKISKGSNFLSNVARVFFWNGMRWTHQGGLWKGPHPRKLTCPLKRNYFNRKYIFQPSFFRGYVSFQWIETE